MSIGILVPVSYDQYPHDLYNLHKKKSIGNFHINKVVIPEGKELQHYTREKGMCRSVFLTPYKSVQLLDSDSSLWMSDTPMEYETNQKAIDQAEGDILELGLGIGLFTYYASKKQIVKSITIVEKEQDVIDLIYPKIKNKKTKIVRQDAIEYLKTTKNKFDTIHVDIWADITHYREIQPIVRIAKKKLKPDGIVISWLEEFLQRVMKEIKSGARRSSGIGYFEPCITCGKILRNDYGGFCMDCADGLGISEMFIKRDGKVRQKVKRHG